MLHELFTAESKSQIYGYLHNYYRLHPSTAKTIGNVCISFIIPYQQNVMLDAVYIQILFVTMMLATSENMQEIQLGSRQSRASSLLQ